MEKSTKVVIVVLVVLAIALGAFYLVLGKYAPVEEEAIVYPESGLSNSIFESQNPAYVPSDSFPQTVKCTYIPYIFDTVEGDVTKIDTAKVLPAGDYFLYYSEVPDTMRTSEEIRTQFSQALRYDCPDDASILETLDRQQGFLNGFQTEYSLNQLGVQMEDGSIQVAYIMAYRLTIDDESAYPFDFIMGVATANLTNEDLETCKNALDANMYTFRYDEDLAELLTKQHQDEAAEAEKAAEQAAAAAAAQQQAEEEAKRQEEEQEGYDASIDLSPSSEDSAASSEPVDTVPNDSKTVGVRVDQDYDNAVLVITWTNPDAKPEIHVTDMDGATDYNRTESADGSMTFDLGNIKEGVLKAIISGSSDCGTFQSEIREK